MRTNGINTIYGNVLDTIMTESYTLTLRVMIPHKKEKVNLNFYFHTSL